MGEGQPTRPMPIPEAKRILNHTQLNRAANQVADYAKEVVAISKKPNLNELHNLERREGTLPSKEQERLKIERSRQIIRSSVAQSKRPIVELLRLKAFTPLYGATRMIAEAIARHTGGRISSDLIRQAQETKRQTTPIDWKNTT